MASPRIGLTAYRETARWGVWDETADLLPATYSRSIKRGRRSADAASAVAGSREAGRRPGRLCTALVWPVAPTSNRLATEAEPDPHTGPTASRPGWLGDWR